MAIQFNLGELAELHTLISDKLFSAKEELKWLNEYDIDEEFWNYDVKAYIGLLKSMRKKINKESGKQRKIEFQMD